LKYVEEINEEGAILIFFSKESRVGGGRILAQSL